MKKISGVIMALTISAMLVSAVYAGAAYEYGTLQENVYDDHDGSGLPGDDPVSTTGTTYGYRGSFDLNTALSRTFIQEEGSWEIDHEQRIFWGTLIQNSGTSYLVVRDSYLKAESADRTQPLGGGLSHLLVSGLVRAAVAFGASQNYYINSSIVSRSWSALSTDAAGKAAQEEGRKELGLYTYGSEAITMDGGYAAYSDLLCNLYSYGSHFQGAEIGIVSGTFGDVTIGTIEDGEKNIDLAMQLKLADKNTRSDKQLGSVVEGGRNAIVVCSQNLPEYWNYQGYSRVQLSKGYPWIKVHKSVLRTDMSLNKGVEYSPSQQAYIAHTAGSVILLKSTNAFIDLDACEMVPDKNGTGCLIHTVITNDTEYGNTLSDGDSTGRINVSFLNMTVEGDIVHEDYQRDFQLFLEGTTLSGSINEYDCDHWNRTAAQEGFAEYAPDASFDLNHGMCVLMQHGAVWNVTKESHMRILKTGEDCVVNGEIYLNGVRQEYLPGTSYDGDVVVMPVGSAAPSQEPETAQVQPETTQAQPETTTAQPETAAASQTAPGTQGQGNHEHNWVSNGGSPATCTNNGVHVWICSICGEEYNEALPALGHDWVFQYELLTTCTEDHCNVYKCSRCGEMYKDVIGEKAYGHTWTTEPIETMPATCTTDGTNVYQCVNCGVVYLETIPALGHEWHPEYEDPPTCTEDGILYYQCYRCKKVEPETGNPALGHNYVIYPTPGEESLSHTYECTRCGETHTEPHVSDGTGSCPACGYTGSYG